VRFQLHHRRGPTGGDLEALNYSLNTTNHEQAAHDYGQQEVYFWQELGYNNKKVHCEQVFFS
jgi:hypothetical protein